MPSAEGQSDVIVVGAGFAGALAALALARQGLRVAAIDLHTTYGSDFRCEKFNAEQAQLLDELGVVGLLSPEGPKALIQHGLRYERMVNAMRGAWPEQVRFHQGRVQTIQTGAATQQVELSTGEQLQGRLVVLATGPGERLRKSLGITKRVLRERHSICIGMTLARPDGGAFGFSSLVRHGERAGDGIGFASFFPMDGAMRVNLFSYRDLASDWARSFRDDPLGALISTFPDLEPLIGDAPAVGPAEFGVTDLYEACGCVMPGVVVIGDAFRSSCPATGMGMTRILTDVRQLVLTHAPSWLASAGMGADKIAAFYADPAKQAVDLTSARRAETARLAATATSLRWRGYRLASRLKRSLTTPPSTRAAA
jgi:2-polyprenyl-6-methoxyphenol hydroxylase-like FAD-dependent oxidoreductase